MSSICNVLTKRDSICILWLELAWNHLLIFTQLPVEPRSLREGGETGILIWPLPDDDNTIVTLLKLSPPTRYYQ